MKTRIKIILIILIVPFLIWAQDSPTYSGTGNPPAAPSDVKEYVEERSEELLGTPESGETVELPTEATETEPEKEAQPAESTDPLPVDSVDETGKPYWVIYFQKGEIGKIADSHNTFFGAGRSRKNQAEADSAARVEFAKNVETRVASSYNELATVTGKKEDYSLEMTTQVMTDLSLKGISITEIWYDDEIKTFFSLIRINREEYAAILEQNIKEELAMQQTRLEQERARVEAEAEEQRLADLEEQHRQEEKARALEEERRKQELREQRKAVIRQKYSRFLERTPQAQMIGFRNAQLASTFQRYGLSTGITPGISPFDGNQLLQRLSFGYTIFNFLEIYGVSCFQDYDDDFAWSSQEIGAKIRLLNNAGDTMRVSLGAGGNLVFYDIIDENEMCATFFASGVLSVPVLLYSDISFYAGLDKISAGIITHPLFFIFGDAIGLIGEVHYLIDDRLRQADYDDGILIQGGLRFKTGKHLSTTLSYEDHSKTVLSIDLYF